MVPCAPLRFPRQVPSVLPCPRPRPTSTVRTARARNHSEKSRNASGGRRVSRVPNVVGAPLPHVPPPPSIHHAPTRIYSRLKLRCDRAIPCGSCVKRGCAAICPDGESLLHVNIPRRDATITRIPHHRQRESVISFQAVFVRAFSSPIQSDEIRARLHPRPSREDPGTLDARERVGRRAQGISCTALD